VTVAACACVSSVRVDFERCAMIGLQTCVMTEEEGADDDEDDAQSDADRVGMAKTEVD
jgi:hypothetical protein